MAQSVARQAVNLQVAGSNPAGGDFLSWCESAVVQWLGYLAFTQETRVQTPVAEIFPHHRQPGKLTSDGIEPPLSDLESEVLPLHHEAGGGADAQRWW